jgi:soluble lytic murein transglycosylase
MFRQFALAAAAVALSVAQVRADEAGELRRALILADGKDWVGAESVAQGAGRSGADVIEWLRLRDGKGTFADYAGFLTRNADWPGLPLLRKAGEDTLGEADPSAIIAYFDGNPPQTGTGSLALVAALSGAGRADEAGAELVRAWRTLSLTAPEQSAFLDRYGTSLAEHHDGRTAAMLAAGFPEDARRMLDLNSPATRAVAEARIALQTNAKGVNALIDKVPAKMAGSWGLALDRFNWRIRKDLYDDASALMLERSESAESLGEPEKWSDWRRSLARREMRVGDATKAYRMASRHHLKPEDEDYADLEWLAGYIALRKLGDAEAAITHFRRVRTASEGPITLSRAGYWEGRAAEKLGRPDEAAAAYGFAADFPWAFYGLLAAEKVGRPFDARLAGGEAYPAVPEAIRSSSVYRAAALLQAAGNRQLAARFLLHLSEGLSGQEIGSLAGQAIEWDSAYIALVLAKAAADKGVIWPRAYYPFMGMHKLDLPVANSLALAIARRESEFNPEAVSSAGARGLMQVMPATAKMMASKLGLEYSAGKLTSDPLYNARLGAAYLEGLVEEFGPSPVLVASGYNAGPGRPRQWMEDRGDPRREDVDVVDWIEHIPFRETQTYVMRVSESWFVYRARLGEDMSGVSFTAKLKGQ